MAINRTKQELRACEDKIDAEAKAALAIIEKAADENRSRTDDENSEIAGHHKTLATLKENKREFEDQLETEQSIQDDIKGLDGDADRGVRDIQVHSKTPTEIASLGDQFIEAKGYKELVEKGFGGEFSTGMVELNTKGTLATTPGTALTPPQYVPGIVETLYQRLYVSDLMPNNSTSSNQVTYVRESTATNAAAAVAEQGTKPESTLVFDEITEPVRKIATILPVTDEMLEDAPSISSYINQRLVLFVKQQEEAQVLTGTGTAPNLAGLLSIGRAAIGTFTRSVGTSNERALFMAANGARGSSFLDPDAVIIHPTNWQAIRLGTDLGGQYYGGGPFYGPYGGPQGPASSSQFSADNVWGLRVVVTSAIPLGTALIGSFSQAAALFRRSGVSVEATNSHSTWFANNITALRAEERLALAVYRPSAFCAVIGLAAS